MLQIPGHPDGSQPMISIESKVPNELDVMLRSFNKRARDPVAAHMGTKREFDIRLEDGAECISPGSQCHVLAGPGLFMNLNCSLLSWAWDWIKGSCKSYPGVGHTGDQRGSTPGQHIPLAVVLFSLLS